MTARLPHLAVLRLSGPDRIAVLQGQTSNDATRVTASQAQLTSFNNPKGRCYAIALLAARGDEHLLVTERSVVELLCKKLRMYILRSKAVAAIADDLTILGADLPDEKPDATAVSPGGPTSFATAADGAALAVHLPAARRLLIAPAAQAAGLADGSAAWRLADIHAGIPAVVAETVEHFVPLWLGLERLGAIDYKKGCYTGQEIVARTHYLGTVKQRLMQARCASDAVPGAKVFGETGQAVGEVVSTAADGAMHALLIATRDAAAYRLGAADGPALDAVAAF